MSVKKAKTLIKKKFGYDFKNLDLLETAITHSSKSETNYETLEFLGDSVLSLAIAEVVFDKQKGAGEGALTKKKAMVVDNRNLANTMKKLGFGSILITAKNQKISQSMMADLFESVMGAIYVDSRRNYNLLKRIIKRVYFSYWKDLNFVDYKSSLQEMAQKMTPKQIPEYKVQEKKDNQFIVGVYLKGKLQTRGNGKSKKEAEQRAARNLINKIKREKIGK